MSSANDTDNEFTPLNSKTYNGPTKLQWIDGEQVLRPDLDAAANGTPGAFDLSYVANKTLEDIISPADEEQFSKLENDQKYDRIVNLVSGVNHRSELFNSRYVHGDPRDLKDILKDLINEIKIWLDPKNGNIFEYGYAIENKLIKFKCAYCSRVLHSEDERAKHAVHMHMSQQRAY